MFHFAGRVRRLLGLLTPQPFTIQSFSPNPVAHTTIIHVHVLGINVPAFVGMYLVIVSNFHLP